MRSGLNYEIVGGRSFAMGSLQLETCLSHEFLLGKCLPLGGLHLSQWLHALWGNCWIYLCCMSGMQASSLGRSARLILLFLPAHVPHIRGFLGVFGRSWLGYGYFCGRLRLQRVLPPVAAKNCLDRSAGLILIFLPAHVPHKWPRCCFCT